MAICLWTLLTLDKLSEFGADVNEGLIRCMNKEEFYLMLINKALSDTRLYGRVILQQVRERLGHADISTTNKYLHCLAEADTEAANVLGNMLISQHRHSNEQTERHNIQKTG